MKKYSRTIVTAALLASACLGLAFGNVRHARAQDIDTCLACHQDQNLTKKDAAGKVHSLYVDKDLFVKSVHGSISCVDCHEGVQATKHPAGGIKDVHCAGCHEEEGKKYLASPHGRLVAAGNPNAPKCYDCHTQHAVMRPENPASSINAENLASTCGACHAEQAKEPMLPLAIDFARGEAPASSFTLTEMTSQIATRVRGHGKDNLAYSYSTKNCSNCHIDQVNHGAVEAKVAVCNSCHGQQKPGIIFGKIHKADVVQNPFLSVLMAFGYIAAIAGLVFFFRPAKKSGPDSGASDA